MFFLEILILFKIVPLCNACTCLNTVAFLSNSIVSRFFLIALNLLFDFFFMSTVTFSSLKIVLSFDLGKVFFYRNETEFDAFQQVNKTYRQQYSFSG